MASNRRLVYWGAARDIGEKCRAEKRENVPCIKLLSSVFQSVVFSRCAQLTEAWKGYREGEPRFPLKFP